jgi:hypothetical protein
VEGEGGGVAWPARPSVRSEHRDSPFLDRSRDAEGHVRSLLRNILAVTDMHKTTAEKTQPGTVTFRGSANACSEAGEEQRVLSYGDKKKRQRREVTV